MNKWRLNKNRKFINFFLLITVIEVITPLIVMYIKNLEKCFNSSYNLKYIENLLNAPIIILNNPIIFLIYLIIAIIFFLTFYNIKNTLKNDKVENIGIKYKHKDGTHGTANFTDVKELNEILQIGNEENTNGIILGKTLDTNEIILLPDDYKNLNRNIIIFGASGTGKSRKFIVPNILKIAEQDERTKQLEKAVAEGKNFVCTDPKGELYCKNCRVLEKRGYQVKLLNLVNPSYSDGIDLIRFIEEKIDAQVFAQVVMTTTQNVGTKKRR